MILLRVQVQEVLHTDESGGVWPETNSRAALSTPGLTDSNVIEVTAMPGETTDDVATRLVDRINNWITDSTNVLSHQLDNLPVASYTNGNNFIEFEARKPGEDYNLSITYSSTADSLIGSQVVGNVPQTSFLEYSLVPSTGGDDNHLFHLDQDGTLKTATTFDFETNASTYTIRVQAKDEFNATVEGNFTVSLTDLNEPPLILSLNSVSVPENSQQVMTLSASDPEGDTVRYFLSGGPDKDRFKLNPITGQLVFGSAPDYENPSDANGDGRYEIGLSVVAANDAQPSFQRANGVENPLHGLDIGATSSPALGDLDADGDLDVIVGTSSGQFEFFLNEGNSTHLQLQMKLAEKIHCTDMISEQRAVLRLEIWMRTETWT